MTNLQSEDKVASWQSGSAAETIALGRTFAQSLLPADVVLLCGRLGAGKTQFVKGVAQGLQVAEPVLSPTFNLVLQYPALTAAGLSVTLNHFDLYRLERADELDDFDYFGMLADPAAINLVEWGDKFPAALSGRYYRLDFSEPQGHCRKIELTCYNGASCCQ
ncbi:MAG: tRNA (adenosine(37)-N6)-threonylcarbamoyltransferase complex ATPase subunit type 1 TsaE [Coriobacteriales bacterium]|jgi:tRNA threonylcarbamoyladenosine biosynthesis protein TsaE|nr:tRNA (adenosine(37)-N6)-threonylcarbamoyltransferase complex ATPase subunit type 1 TsaE [Coriobacteriales bacterium]